MAGGGVDPGVRSPTVAWMFDAVASGYDRCFAHVTRLFIPALLDAAQVCPAH